MQTPPHFFPESCRMTAAIVVVFGGLLTSAAPAPAHADGSLPPAKTFQAYDGLESSLRVGSGDARVLIHVRGSSAAAVAADATALQRRQLAGQPNRSELDALASASEAGREEIAAQIEGRREDALDALQPTVDETLDAQAPVARAVEAVGGSVLEVDSLMGTITALVSRADLSILASRDDVTAITSAPADKPLALRDATDAVGAPAFWAAGFLGGRGANDTTGPDIALIGDRIYQQHPAFAGIAFQTPEWDNELCPPTIGECAHGTQVAGMAFSRGVAGTGTASDADQKGVAPGVDSVLDADMDYWTPTAWLLGIDQSGGDLLHGSQPGADDPAEVVNASYGNESSDDDAPGARGFDALAGTYGVTSAIAAGNEGPSSATVNSPCIAYDSICAGAFKIWSPGDWRIPNFSSRGPTVGGRKKPDLVANGSSATANPNWQSDGQLWAGVEGTSFAAPQVAGAATLLAGSGVTHHLAHKAVLINSARQGRKTPSDPMGSQTYWQPDWGWGALDLASALEQRSAVVPSTSTAAGVAGNHAVAELGEGDVHFYSATTQAAGDRATLVWDRRAVACIRVGCPEGSFGMTLTNLGLSETSADGSTVRHEVPSSVDNVEQVRSPGAASVIYKVKGLSAIDGATAEPYSLASRRPIKRLATPRPRVTVSSNASEARPGQDVTVTANIANPSPDLPAGDVTATLELPAGAQLVSGASSRALGPLAANATSTQSWVVRFAGDGNQVVRVAVSSSALSEPLPAAGSAAIAVDGTAPNSSLNAPSGARTDTNLPVAWSASDSGSGVASHDVEVAVDGGPFTAWLTSTSSTSATYGGQVGFSYQFRARSRDRLGNESGWTTGPVAAITAPAPPPAPAPPTAAPTPAAGPAPSPAKRVATSLRVSTAKLSSTAIKVTGTRSSKATGTVTVEFAAKVRGRVLKTRKTASVTRGRFTATLKLPARMRGVRAGTVTVRYAGDSKHLPRTATRKTRRS